MTLQTYRRDVLGVTLVELAARHGKSKTRLGAIEAGELPKFKPLRLSYARVYRLPLARFEALAREGAK